MDNLEDSPTNGLRERSRSFDLFVNNLHLAVTREELVAMFEEYGRVRHVTIIRREEFKTHKFGYVVLDSAESTRLAIKELDGTHVRGLQLRVERSFGRTAHSLGESPEEELWCNVARIGPGNSGFGGKGRQAEIFPRFRGVASEKKKKNGRRIWTSYLRSMGNPWSPYNVNRTSEVFL